jgi:hypothetical protein
MLTIEQMPKAVEQILCEVKEIKAQIQLTQAVSQPNPDRMINLVELQTLVFPQWKRQTIYNKCNQSEIPHYKIEGKLMFNLQECLQWRDSKMSRKIKGSEAIDTQAAEFLKTIKI